MATREENLKKINAEPEKMTDEELDQVAGGTYIESSSDAIKFQNELGVKIYDTEIVGVPVLQHNEFVKLRDAFSQYGVKVEDHGGLINENKYFIDGNQVSRDDAWKHIMAQAGK